MSTLSPGDRRVYRLCQNAILLALAMMFSFVEHLIPLSLFLPLPGVKLGLANVVIAILFYMVSPWDAGIVSLLRIVLSALLFGTPISFLFSLFGGLLSYLVLWICRPFFQRFFSFIGVSVLSATGHHLGQMTAAVMVFDTGVLLTYLPVLLMAGLLTGGIVGVVLNMCATRLQKLLKGGENH